MRQLNERKSMDLFAQYAAVDFDTLRETLWLAEDTLRQYPATSHGGYFVSKACALYDWALEAVEVLPRIILRECRR